VLGNDKKLTTFTLSYASTAYRNMVQEGTWDEVLQKPAGCSSFLAREGDASQQSSEPLATTGNSGVKCFNCGGQNIFATARSLVIMRRLPKTVLCIQMVLKITPFKWRKPEEGEHKNLRVIDKKPHTWDPNSDFKGCWIFDSTPNAGQPDGGLVPEANFGISVWSWTGQLGHRRCQWSEKPSCNFSLLRAGYNDLPILTSNLHFEEYEKGSDYLYYDPRSVWNSPEDDLRHCTEISNSERKQSANDVDTQSPTAQGDVTKSTKLKKHKRSRDRFANLVSFIASVTFVYFNHKATFHLPASIAIPNKKEDNKSVLKKSNWNLDDA